MEPKVYSIEGESLELGGKQLGLHYPSFETAAYWDGIKEGKLLIKKCLDCGCHLHPRRLICSQCLSLDMDWMPSSGEGLVYSYSVVYRPPVPQWDRIAPYIVGIVELKEAVYLFSNIICSPDDVKIGLPVQAIFEPNVDNVLLPVFVPKGGIGA